MTQQPLSFVTGATGFVGSAVARVLLKRGHRLRLLARPGSDRRNLRGLDGVEIVEGDLGSPESYAHALEGCDALFHVAADYRIWVPDIKAMNLINVEGTRALMQAAMKASIQKIVYTSSVATIGLPRGGGDGTEATPVALSDMIGAYKKSKFMAEQVVREMIAKNNLRAVIVHPSTPVGPRDVKPTPTGRIIVEAALGRLPAYVDTGLNIVHVDDVAEGHVLALEKGHMGDNYILGGENLLLKDILTDVAKMAGRTPPLFCIPREPLFPLAYLAEGIARLTGKEPFLTVDGLKMAKKKMFFSSDKARHVLGYRPRPAAEALADALAWFRQECYC